VEHLSLSRLIALSTEAVVTSPVESEHLRTCHQWLQILRRFAEERRRAKDEREGIVFVDRYHLGWGSGHGRL